MALTFYEKYSPRRLIRLIEFPDVYLNGLTGSRGEIYYDGDSDTLRVMDGVAIGGYPLARADLDNVAAINLTGKIKASGVVNTTSSFPVDPLDGMLYFDTVTEQLYIYINDGSSTQAWTAISGGGGGNSFSTIAVTGQTNVVADSSSDTLTLSAGTGMSITTNSGTDTVTISSTVTSFSTIAVAGESNVVADSASDTLTLAAGSGITITTNAGTDTITIAASGGGGGGASALDDLTDVQLNSPTNNQVLKYNGSYWTNATDATSGGGAASNSFETITVAGQSSVIADSSTDNLTLAAGAGITITTNATTDTVTFASTGVTSITVAGTGLAIDQATGDVTITGSGGGGGGGVTYSISAETGTGGANLRLTDSSASTDEVLFAGSGTVTVSRTDANTITVSGAAPTLNIDDLADVVITSPSNNQVLKYNGSQWVNGTDATSGGGAASNSFETITVAGQSSVVADSSTDSLTLVAGTGMTITTNATTDTVTWAYNQLMTISAAVSAAGTTQGTATALTTTINNVTSASAGSLAVKMPTAQAGWRVTVLNNTATTISIFPDTGASINALAANAAYSLGSGGRLDFIATTTTQWYSMNAVYA